MEKNVAGQSWVVFAFDRTDNTPKTGLSNIVGNLRIDGASAVAIDDTNPTELEGGYYVFTLTAAETNGDNIIIAPSSVTADIQVIGCPAVVYTRPENFNALGVEADGDIEAVTLTRTATTVTGGATSAEVSAVETKVDTVDTVVDGIKTKTDNLPTDPADQSLVIAATDAIKADTADILVDTSTTIPAALNTADEIAEAILKYDWDGMTGEANRSMLNALRFLRNKWTAAGGTLTVTKEDDSTSAWTAALTSDSSADPITGSDPA